jgi:hypothetical protein
LKAKVFIGSSSGAVSIAELAQAELSRVSEPQIWTNGNFPVKLTPIESLFLALDKFDFALFVTLPEDVTTKRGVGSSTMRDNVLFEMGLFLGRLGRDHVYLIAPNNTAELALNLPTDLTGIEPSHYNPTADNLQASVGTALQQMKVALREFEGSTSGMIFDSATKLSRHQIVAKGGRKWDVSGTPISDFAQGVANLSEGIFELQRTNGVGVFEIEIRPNGPSEPSISRLSKERLIRISFKGRVENAAHKIRILLLDTKFWWLANECIDVKDTSWRHYESILTAAPHLDILVRLDDEIDVTPSGRLFLRDISISEVTA